MKNQQTEVNIYLEFCAKLGIKPCRITSLDRYYMTKYGLI